MPPISGKPHDKNQNSFIVLKDFFFSRKDIVIENSVMNVLRFESYGSLHLESSDF